MRDVVAGMDEVGIESRGISGGSGSRFHVLAVYSAFALIAAVVFGTLTYHPF